MRQLTRRGHVIGITVAVLGLVAGGLALTNKVRETAPKFAVAMEADNKAAAKAMAAAPLSFEPNVGQGDPATAFVARGLGFSLELSPTEATISAGDAPLRMRLLGANPRAPLVGGNEQDGRINYLVGDNPSAWRTDIATYGQVAHNGVWPGVDLIWHGSSSNQLEYDFVVAPGSDPKTIAVGFDGTKGVRLDNGELVLATESGELRHRAPVLYQEANSARTSIPGSFVLDGDTVRFSVGAYDTTRPLIIDPILEYSTYLGGPKSPYEDIARGIAVDAAGAAYVTGKTCSTYFPVTTYAPQKLRKGKCDAFVTKFKPVQGTGIGTGIKYSTYLGGAANDEGVQIAVDGAGNAYVMGSTGSSDFPTTAGAYSRTTGSTFLTKFSPKGNLLLYSTRMVGQQQSGLALGPALPATPAQPTVYLSGEQLGPTPTPGAFQATCHLRSNGDDICEDFWLAKFNPVGGGTADLLYATYLGGTDAERYPGVTGGGGGLAVDGFGRAYITGLADSLDFPMAGPSGGLRNIQPLSDRRRGDARLLVARRWDGCPVGRQPTIGVVHLPRRRVRTRNRHRPRQQRLFDGGG